MTRCFTSVFDKGLESFLRKFVSHLIGVGAGSEGAHLDAEKVVVRVGIFRRHQENRVTPCLQNINERFGILLGAQRGNLKSNPLSHLTHRRD